ncbi:hypothetical protein [Pontibacillus marinus]|uniref:Lipoprotein n=1 Tax=Pontibacillus marinus BH030004 = DSM 16465 TaxID=1385511 RepID=A0A0A5FWP9_9BACI|nr:hypothetical protein [Pontibacillus marinus]KGX83100.1 hypothetical protein N783_09955 [Pontibacillus marinus BH030004 = DSM 16465]
MKGNLLLIVVLATCFLTSCNNTDQVDQDGGPRYTEEILDIDSSDNKILVKGNSECGDFWFNITNETSLTETSGEAITFEDLEEGDVVDLWFTGDFSLNCSQGEFVQKEEYTLVFLEVKK